MTAHFTGIYSSIGRVARSILIVLMVLGLLGPTAAYAHPPGVTEWVSVSSDGTGANNQSDMPALSGDGRFIAFVSLADNLNSAYDSINEGAIYRITFVPEPVSLAAVGVALLARRPPRRRRGCGARDNYTGPVFTSASRVTKPC